jgi:hypothetical protein
MSESAFDADQDKVGFVMVFYFFYNKKVKTRLKL